MLRLSCTHFFLLIVFGYTSGNRFDLFDAFPCPTTEAQSEEVPTSVHTLRPGDIQCVAAIGDGMTAGVGALAVTTIGLLFENRGVVWSVGGDHSYEKVVTLPNILRQYNPSLKGYSTETTTIFPHGQNATHNGLNVALTGAYSRGIIDQTNLLLFRLKNEQLCDWNNDWKLITLLIGGSDFCLFCKESSLANPAQLVGFIRDALDELYQNVPRTLVNLVLTFDFRDASVLSQTGPVCRLYLEKLCPCAVFPTVEQQRVLDEWIPQYEQLLLHLIESGRYDGRDDFTVVIQPFLTGTKVPVTKSNSVDLSYFAPDCFHLSGKSHAITALGLWNNMLEAVGSKRVSVHSGDTLHCPSKEYPYIFTSRNSH